MIATGVRMQPAYGGPAITLQENGHVDVSGYGAIMLSKWDARVNKWRDLIRSKAIKFDFPEAWIASVMQQESHGVANATAPDGGIGLMQITSSTLFHGHTRQELYDPDLNVEYGTEYLRNLADHYGWNPVHVAAGYNAGGVYRWTGKNCPSPGLWNMNTACSYPENIVRGINTAIVNGFSGTGATFSSSKWFKVFGVAALFALPVAGYVIARRRL